jgi:hypothetical protein
MLGTMNRAPLQHFLICPQQMYPSKWEMFWNDVFYGINIMIFDGMSCVEYKTIYRKIK